MLDSAPASCTVKNDGTFCSETKQLAHQFEQLCTALSLSRVHLYSTSSLSLSLTVILPPRSLFFLFFLPPKSMVTSYFGGLSRMLKVSGSLQPPDQW